MSLFPTTFMLTKSIKVQLNKFSFHLHPTNCIPLNHLWNDRLLLWAPRSIFRRKSNVILHLTILRRTCCPSGLNRSNMTSYIESGRKRSQETTGALHFYWHADQIPLEIFDGSPRHPRSSPLRSKFCDNWRSIKFRLWRVDLVFLEIYWLIVWKSIVVSRTKGQTWTETCEFLFRIHHWRFIHHVLSLITCCVIVVQRFVVIFEVVR